MTRYVIIGAGAVGATLGAELLGAGIPAVLVARGEHLAALRRDGLRHLRPDGEQVLRVPTVGGPDELALEPGDVLVLATKAQDAEEALAAWAWQPVKGAGTAAEALPVVTLQNGLDAERVALRRFATVYGGVVWSTAAYLAPGEVSSPNAPAVGVIWLGRYPAGTDARVQEIAADLRAARHLAEVVPDITRWKAGKLLPILGNALDALYPPSPLRDRAAAAVVQEARRVYAAAGIDPADIAAETALDLREFASHPIPGRPATGRSTWQSLHRGARLESDFLNGEVTLLARLHGIGAPRNAAVLARVQRAARDGVAAGSLGDDDLRATLPELDVLVDAGALAAELAGPRPPVLLDVRWALGDPHGREHHRAGHLPGAVYVALDTELAAHNGTPTDGRHPLPDVADLQDAARRWGVTAQRPVVAYDATGGLAAARAWWLLRWAGHTDVRLLDGGLAAWTGPVESGDVPDPAPGDVVLDGGHLPVLDADGAATLARTGLLLDARAAERYRGEVEPIDPRGGHVPGAVSAPTGANLDADGRFLGADALRARFAALRPDSGEVGVYCGSGVTAAHEIAALAVAGIPAALFPGSWSAWSSDPARPRRRERRRERHRHHRPGRRRHHRRPGGRARPRRPLGGAGRPRGWTEDLQVRASRRTDRSGVVPDGIPDAVVLARSAADVVETLAHAYATRTPVIVRGAGTGLSGGATAGPGTIVLDTSGLTRIREISPADELAVAEAGVITADLDRAAAAHGLRYAPDPASVAISTLGGNIATNAGGLRCAKYGVTRDSVLGLDVVLGDGRRISTGRRTVKGVTGLDLTGLFVGSEGALGVIVAATVRLRPIPPRTATLAAWFPDPATAAAAAAAITAARVQPAVAELLDTACVEAVAAADPGFTPQGGAFLLVQTDGFGADAEIDAIGSAVAPYATQLDVTADAGRAEELLATRRAVLPALERLGRVLIEDVAVPRSRLPEAVAAVAAIARRSGIRIATLAHAGDGNLHPILVLDQGRELDEHVWNTAGEVFTTALRLGGTLTGEHGVGLLKRRWLADELGGDVLAVQRDLKTVFDPHGVLNPGRAI